MNNKALTLIILPIFIIGSEIFIKSHTAVKTDISGLGTSLASMGVGLTIPYLVLENLAMLKLFTLVTTQTTNAANQVIPKMEVIAKHNTPQFVQLHNNTILAFIISFVIFVLSVHYSMSPDKLICSICLGIANCIYGIYYNW
jgi:hypothetical protein